MIYWILLLVCCGVGLMVILKSPPRPRYAYAALSPVMVMLFLSAALRWRTGWDWEGYDAFFSITSFGGLGHISGDFMFDVTLLVSRWLGMTPYILPAAVIVFLFFVVLIQRSVAYLAAPISLILFLWYGYYSAWSTIRQGMSIAFLTLGFLDIKSKYKYLFFLLAILFHKTAIFPIFIYFLWKWLSLRSRKTLLLLGISAFIIILMARNFDVLDLFSQVSILSLIGENRALSFFQREFLLASYPLLTGRMVELLISITTLALALRRRWRSRDDELILAPQSRTWITLLLAIQCQHLMVYVICSPLTILAERMILYYDIVHALGVGGSIFLIIRMALGVLRPIGTPLMRETRLVLSVAFLVSAGYIVNRYYNIFHAESREVGELTHAERFFPYRSILE